jgi:hypothetical protein
MLMLTLLGLNAENPVMSVTYHKNGDGESTFTTNPSLPPGSLATTLLMVAVSAVTVPNGTSIEVSRDAADKVLIKLNGELLATDVGHGVGWVIEIMNGLSQQLCACVKETVECFGTEERVRQVVGAAYVSALHDILFAEGDLASRPTKVKVVCATCLIGRSLTDRAAQIFGAANVEIVRPDGSALEFESADKDSLEVHSPIVHDHPLFTLTSQALEAWVNARFAEFDLAATRQIRDRLLVATDRLEAAFPGMPAYEPPAEEVAASGSEDNGVDNADQGGLDHPVEQPTAEEPAPA